MPAMTQPPAVPIAGTLLEHLGMRSIEMDRARVVIEMDVGPHVHQPMGLLHGGASAALAETAASIGAWLHCGPGQHAVGIELNVSHLRAVRTGVVRAEATPVRAGKSIHVWAVDVVDESGERVAVARCTLALREGAS